MAIVFVLAPAGAPAAAAACRGVVSSARGCRPRPPASSTVYRRRRSTRARPARVGVAAAAAMAETGRLLYLRRAAAVSGPVPAHVRRRSGRVSMSRDTERNKACANHCIFMPSGALLSNTLALRPATMRAHWSEEACDHAGGGTKRGRDVHRTCRLAHGSARAGVFESTRIAHSRKRALSKGCAAGQSTSNSCAPRIARRGPK